MNACRNLVRRLGGAALERGDGRLAEAYYRLATSLNPVGADPEAFFDLVALVVNDPESYGAGNQLTQEARSRLDQLRKDYAVQLFVAKAREYARGEKERIFSYHRSLGALYSALGRWESTEDEEAASAIFQLERALTVAEYLADDAQGKETPLDRSPFTPEMAHLLLICYQEADKHGKADELRDRILRHYADLGDNDAMRTLDLLQEQDEVPQPIYLWKQRVRH